MKKISTLKIKNQKKWPKVFKEKYSIKRGIVTFYKSMIGKGFNREQKLIKLFEKFMNHKPTKKEFKKISEHFGKHYQKSLNTYPLFRCNCQ